jgi:hypothetical protein
MSDTYGEVEDYGEGMYKGETYWDNIFTIKESVINIHPNSTIDIIPDSNLDLQISNCETNRSELDFSGYDLTGCTFEKTGPTLLPSSLNIENFNVQNFTYKIYSVENQGGGQQVWDTYGINTGLMGETRLGIGAFLFVDRVLYVDGDRSSSGDGSNNSPFNYGQLRNYFNPDEGVACNTLPADGDIIFFRGTADIINHNSFITIKNTLPGTIIIKAWDISKNGLWKIESRNVNDPELAMISNVSSGKIDSIDISDCIFLSNSPNTNVARIESETVEPGSNIKIKNSIVYVRDGDLILGSSAGVIKELNGCTIRCDGEIILYGGGNLTMNDVAMKAGVILDSY